MEVAEGKIKFTFFYSYLVLASTLIMPSPAQIDFHIDKEFACGSDIINVSVNTTVPWAVYKSR